MKLFKLDKTFDSTIGTVRYAGQIQGLPLRLYVTLVADHYRLVALYSGWRTLIFSMRLRSVEYNSLNKIVDYVEKNLMQWML